MHQKYKWMTVGLLAICLLFGGLLSMQAGYRRAEAALSEWSLSEWAFTQAAQNFGGVPDFYRDTKRLRQYARAGELFHQGEYEQAKALFHELGEYRESAQFLPECDYRQAAALLRQGQALPAHALFLSIHAYRDSGVQLLACEYQMAKDYLEAGAPEQARPLFEALAREQYLDSELLLLEAEYRRALAFGQAQAYGEALQLLRDLGGYGNAAKALQSLQKEIYSQALGEYERYMAGEEGAYLECVRLFCFIQEHADSLQYLELIRLGQAVYEEPVLETFAARAAYAKDCYARLLALWESGLRPAGDEIERYYLDEFLEGRWKGDGKTLRVTINQKNGDITYVHDLPGSKSTQIKTEDGVLYFGSREDNSWTKMYTYTLVDPNTVSFYVFSNDRFYTMKRQ